MTVNELFVLTKIVRERIADLKKLRESVSTSTRYYGEGSKEITPQYNVKDVDKRIVELQNFLLKADSAIKQSNAVTKVEFSTDTDALLRPIE